MSFPAPSSLTVNNMMIATWGHPTAKDFILEIFDMSGKRVHHEEVLGAKSVKLSDPSRPTLPPGLYTVRVAAKDPTGGTGTPPTPDYGDWTNPPCPFQVQQSWKSWGNLKKYSFHLVIAIVLIGAIIGGIWWMKNRQIPTNDDPPATTTPEIHSEISRSFSTNVTKSSSGGGSQITTSFGNVGNSNVIQIQSIINNYGSGEGSEIKSWPTNIPPKTNITLRPNMNAKVGTVEIFEFILRYNDDVEFFVPQGWRAQPGFDAFERRPDYAIDGVPVHGYPTGFKDGETFRIRNRKSDKGSLKVYVRLERRSSDHIFPS